MMKKRIIALFLVMMFAFASMSTYAMALTYAIADENISIRTQADTLIVSVDETALLEAALSNQVDYSVPADIRESIVAEASFQPVNGVEQSEIELEVTSTVKKLGEIARNDGSSSNLYVAVAAATEEKQDSQYVGQHGIKAWAIVYWIDNLGTNNELYGAAGKWDPKDKVVENRQVSYGTTDIFWLLWLDGPTVKYPTDNWAYYKDPSSYTGYVLRCQTKIDVVNVGTVTCNVASRIVT